MKKSKNKKNKKNKKDKKNKKSKSKKDKKDKKRAGRRRVTAPLGQVARPPAPPRSYPHTTLHQTELSFAPGTSSSSVLSARPCVPRGVRRPILALTGAGS